MKDLKITDTKRVIDNNGEISYVPIQDKESSNTSVLKGDNTNLLKKDTNYDKELSGGDKAEVYSQAITEGAKLVNKVLDIVKIREQTDSSLKTMDKQIELVERTTESEIKKMLAETDSWEKRFSMVSKLLQDMTITVTTNKDLHPDVAKALVDAVKEAMTNMSKRD